MLRGVCMIKATATDNTSQLQAERVINSFCYDDVSYQFIDWLYRLHIYCIYIYILYTLFDRFSGCLGCFVCSGGRR